MNRRLEVFGPRAAFQIGSGLVERFAVVVPSAGPFDSLDRTVRSLEHAAARASLSALRVIVVDDASEPRTGLGRLGESVEVVGGGRLGAGPARNLGAAAAKADWLLFVDDDVEVDELALQALESETSRVDIEVIVGRTRAPEASPAWLHDAYSHGLLGSRLDGHESADAGIQLVSTLLAVRRDVFERVGGYPERAEWGVTDVLFGLRLQVDNANFAQPADFSGVHHYVPSWHEWLRRREKAGARFAALSAELSPVAASQLLAATRLDRSLRSAPKWLASYVPRPLLEGARSRLLRRLAAAGMEARGFRQTGGSRA